MQAFLGNSCLLCGVAAGDDFCSPCRESLPHLPSQHCVVCALPVTESAICGACLANPPAFDSSVAAVNYAFPVDALLHSFKYQANLAIAPILAELLAAQIDTDALPDVIVPMPLHPTRLRERGFNQA